MKFTCRLSIIKVIMQTALCVAIGTLCTKVGYALLPMIIEGDLYAIIGLLMILFFMLCFCISPLYAIVVYCKKYKTLDIIKEEENITVYCEGVIVTKSKIVMIDNENTLRLFPVNYYRITLTNKESVIIPSVATNISKLTKGYAINFNYGLWNLIPYGWN